MACSGRPGLLKQLRLTSIITTCLHPYCQPMAIYKKWCHLGSCRTLGAIGYHVSLCAEGSFILLPIHQRRKLEGETLGPTLDTSSLWRRGDTHFVWSSSFSAICQYFDVRIKTRGMDNERRCVVISPQSAGNFEKLEI